MEKHLSSDGDFRRKKSHLKRGFYASQEYQGHSTETTEKTFSKLEAA